MQTTFYGRGYFERSAQQIIVHRQEMLLIWNKTVLLDVEGLDCQTEQLRMSQK